MKILNRLLALILGDRTEDPVELGPNRSIAETIALYKVTR